MKPELWYDKLFVKHIVKQVQKQLPEVGIIMYQDKMIMVFMYDNIILHKLYLDQYNTETMKIEDHIEQMKTRLNLLKKGFIPVSTLRDIRKNISRLNINHGKIM
jgi:hypothetical protein